MHLRREEGVSALQSASVGHHHRKHHKASLQVRESSVQVPTQCTDVQSRPKVLLFCGGVHVSPPADQRRRWIGLPRALHPRLLDLLFDPVVCWLVTLVQRHPPTGSPL